MRPSSISRAARRLALLGAAAALLLSAPGASALTVEIGFEGSTETFGDNDLGCSSAGNQGELSCVGGVALADRRVACPDPG